MDTADEYEAVAEFCAIWSNVHGSAPWPIPLDISPECEASIVDDMPAFQERVRAYQYAIAMDRVNVD